MRYMRALLRVFALLALGLYGSAVEGQSRAPAAKEVPGPVMEMIATWQNAGPGAHTGSQGGRDSKSAQAGALV